MIKTVTSRKNEIVLKTLDLRKNKIQFEEEKFIIEGEHLLDMALKTKNVLYILTTKHLNFVDEKINQYIVTKDILEKISTSKSAPNVIAVCSFVKNKLINSKNLVYLDRVQDPGNLGTILRTCLAFCYFNILISEDSANIYNDKVIQSSQGSIFDLNIERISPNDIIKYKNLGYKIVATSLEKNAINLSNFLNNDNEKYLIIFGNEGNGVRKEILELADYRIFIEMKNIDSLNVGVAAGIVLYNFKN